MQRYCLTVIEPRKDIGAPSDFWRDDRVILHSVRFAPARGFIMSILELSDRHESGQSSDFAEKSDEV